MTCPMPRGVSPERRLCKAVLEMEKQTRGAGCAKAGLDIGQSITRSVFLFLRNLGAGGSQGEMPPQSGTQLALILAVPKSPKGWSQVA